MKIKSTTPLHYKQQEFKKIIQAFKNGTDYLQVNSQHEKVISHGIPDQFEDYIIKVFSIYKQ
jgi:hypothetical protein